MPELPDSLKSPPSTSSAESPEKGSSSDQVEELTLMPSNPDNSETALKGNTGPIIPLPAAVPSPASFWLSQIGNYRVVGEIGRGGMGVILRAFDGSFHRPLAVKLLLEENKDDPDLRRRFVEEAQIMGQLQHPGIPPVHEKGELDDGRLYFSMKLIKGRTLAAVLAQRENPQDNLPELLGIFEQICQTLGYVHSRGVIHRDLKPDNIMVGAFGEVQVMDWGLAKALRSPNEGEFSSEIESGDSTSTIIVASGTSQTQMGSVMGTPAYMAPEQARGDIENLDERADVFGLGAILCEILTGKPAFSKKSTLENLTNSVQGDLSEAWGRLANCGADEELMRLARWCLAPDKDQRPAQAGVVAETIANYQRSVQERLRQAEIEEAASQAKAAEERKRRKITLGLALVALLFVLTGSGAGLWYYHDRADRASKEAFRQAQKQTREKQVNQKMQEILTDTKQQREELVQRLSDPQRVYQLLNDLQKWESKLDKIDSSMKQAKLLMSNEKNLLKPELIEQYQHRWDQCKSDRADFQLAKTLDKIREDACLLTKGRWDEAAVSPKYEQAFSKVGMEVKDGDLQELGRYISQTPIRYVLVSALDHWADVTDELDLRKQLLQITKQADPDPWRDQFRNVEVWNDRDKLEKLAKKINLNEQSPAIIISLAHHLENQGGDGINILEEALFFYPQDFWIYMKCDEILHGKDPIKRVGFLRAALVIRPESSAANLNLGVAFYDQEDFHRAIKYFDKARKTDKENSLADLNYAKAQHALGKTYHAAGEFSKAIEAYQEAKPLLAFEFQDLLTRKIQSCQRCLRLQDQEPLQPLDLATLGKGIQGRLTQEDPLDIYSHNLKCHRKAYVVFLKKGKFYQIDLTGDFNTYLRVENPSFQTLSDNNDVSPPNDSNSRLIFCPETDGLYRLVVTSFYLPTTGNYTLKVREVTPFGEAWSQDGKLSTTDKVQDEKFYRLHQVQLQKETAYTIYLESHDFDTIVMLQDPRAMQIALNDDTVVGNPQFSRLDYTPTQTGTYTVVVTSFRSGETGSYTLRVQGYKLVRREREE